MATSTNVIFLGCNYSNKKVKGHFEALKVQWESEWPVRVNLIDKQRAKGSRDLWKEIREAIQVSALAIFDVSAFRPNVVLELGYALALKDEEAILVSFDERRARGGKKPEWTLSDIGHLNRHTYKTLQQLDQKLVDNLEKVPAIARFRALQASAKQDTNAADKYGAAALDVLHGIRDKKTLSDQQFEAITRGTAIRVKTLKAMLKKHKLAKRTQGPNGRWSLVEV